MGYDQSLWSGFAGTLEAVADALAGLSFVAVSIKSELLSASRNLTSRGGTVVVPDRVVVGVQVPHRR